MNRRTAIQTTALAAGATLISGVSTAQKNNIASMKEPSKVRHSASRWCYGSIPLEEFVIEAKKLGVTSVELTGPKDWPILKKHGLTCAMGNGKFPEGTGLTSFWGEEKHHDALVAFYEDLVPKAKAAGIPSLICFSGNRNGRSDYEGLRICAKGIKRVIKLFEENDIIMSMELFNSKINHPDYFADSTIWGVTLCDMVGSEHFKLLYDIYHMQIMEGDIIRTIQDYHTYFNHYHTGGVPGRREINDSQELYYPAIIKAIMATGYTGFVGQEFIPTPEDNAGKLASLKEAVKICSI